MGIQTWLVSVALKKGVQRGVQAAVAYLAGILASPAVQGALSGAGVSIAIDPNITIGFLTITAMAGIEVARNWLKHKLGLKWL